METYHKIQTLFKRHLDGKNKGKMIRGAWTTPALEYLAKSQWEWTEKVDGTNIRIGMNTDENLRTRMDFRGRSDNAVLPVPLSEYLHDYFTPRAFEEAGIDGNAVLFGEGYGPKIQNGGLYREDQSFVLFDVKIGGFWLERDNVNDIAEKLGIESVPVIGSGTLLDAIEVVESGITFTDFGGVKRWGRGGLRSQWGDFEAEGIVARPITPLFDRKGDRIITKIKGVDFK